MKSADLPHNEAERLARLRSFEILDTLPHQAFDHITSLASSICGTQIALVTLIDEHRQWFKSSVGLSETETERDVAFCAHAILQPEEVMVVRDATQDDRFHDNPFVTGGPAPVRFYAGAPIVTDDGFPMGTVCVIDTKVRELSGSQMDSLRALAGLVNELLKHEKLQREQAQRSATQVNRDIEVMQSLLTSGRSLKSFVDRNYIYRFVNATYLDYWRQQPEDIIGRHVAELVGQDQFERTSRPNIDRALSGEAVHYETSIDFPYLGLRQFDVSFLPARDSNGQVIGVVVRAMDIQRRKEREAQLQETLDQLQRKTIEQDRFIHIISHDLREPINSINNFAKLLDTDVNIVWPGATRRYLDFVRQGGLRMEALLNDLLDFVQTDQHVAQLQEVDLDHLAAQVRDDLAQALERTSGQLEIGRLPVVWGDSTLLRIALQNLVSNGLKFSRPGVIPKVVVSSRNNGDCLELEVCDNGIGIAAEHQGKIFDIFQRLHSRKQFVGAGLGLSICRRIAELHHGTLSVTSSPGEGSAFILSLPLNPGATAAQEHL